MNSCYLPEDECVDVTCPIHSSRSFDPQEDVVRTAATIMLSADGGCYFCAGRLLSELRKALPAYTLLINEVWRNKYDFDLGEGTFE